RIHRSSFAPVLSATLQRVSCWITYFALSTTSTTRHRFDLLTGRVSITRTVSPSCASFASSCAASFEERRTILPYNGCRTWRSIRTTTVLSILSEITTPVRIFRLLRPASASAAAGLVSRLLTVVLLLAPLGGGRDRVELQLDLALAQHRRQPRHVVAQLLQPGDGVQLAGGELEAEVEQLLLRPLDPDV